MRGEGRDTRKGAGKGGWESGAVTEQLCGLGKSSPSCEPDRRLEPWMLCLRKGPCSQPSAGGTG